ncbi:anti-sigma-F factor Fin family protein (plasmid) [Radiobacillus kanasensis]|uniref:anti-sigma-F factor Fin family protein n=1 Tax=Radiobacillus kanasensis TaxID=2844358 RepID=UPI001E322987|nr:anti-sigma-F factor Fin family protein [Radiobacillus kanasensis]UFU01525.1 anti-sigma-F factor Fin family protein [Radiobacillus kanasensis]
MSLIYTCNHCGNNVGELHQKVVDTQSLGWHELSEQEKREMIQYQDNGDIHVKTICENCQESLDHNPHYHELDYFIQ